jgi:ubiquinol-cytochrome c reductase cytochrome b subunit
VLILLIVLHLVALRHNGSNNPDGIEIKANKGPDGKPVDGIPFHPYYTVKDLYGVSVFLVVFSAIVFFSPEVGGYFLEYNNFVPADPLKTPEHIAPVWYFTPFYAMLRAVPPIFNSQFPGVAVMGAATMILFLLPWLDRGKVKSIRYRGPVYKSWFAAFIIAFLLLGYLGVEPTTVWGEFGKGLPVVGGDYIALWVARVLTVVYFLFFLLMPWYTRSDKEKPEPQRVTW